MAVEPARGRKVVMSDSEMTERPHPYVLIIEDDESTGEAVAFHLRRAGFEPRLETDGLAGLQALQDQLPAVLVLDLMLPSIDGWQLIGEVRQWAPNLPIVVMTARTNEHNRVEVLDLGADDVVSKPFLMRELVARVAVAHRRTSRSQTENEPQPITHGDLMINPDLGVASIAGQPIVLTNREFELLWTLVAHHGQVLSRDVIYRRVWRRNRRHDNRSVDVLVRGIRRKVDDIGGNYTYIQTQHGVGYRFAAVRRQMPRETIATRSGHPRA